MQRKSFIKLLLPALGYMVMGNILSFVMAMSLAFFRGETLIMLMSVLFAAAIYLMMVSVPAYKNGQDEFTKLKNKTGNEAEAVPKYRWLSVGMILWGIMLIPSVVYLFGGIPQGVYLLLSGAVYPLSGFFMKVTEYDADGRPILMSLLNFAPFVFMGFYALTVPACHIGFMLGLSDKLSKENMMYK